MKTSMNRHPFALPAVVLSVLITSTMALIPFLAGAGTSHASQSVQTLQAGTAQSQNVNVAG